MTAAASPQAGKAKGPARRTPPPPSCTTTQAATAMAAMSRTANASATRRRRVCITGCCSRRCRSVGTRSHRIGTTPHRVREVSGVPALRVVLAWRSYSTSLSSCGSCGWFEFREVPVRVWIGVSWYFEARVTLSEGPDRRSVPLDEETFVQLAILWVSGEVLCVHGAPECTGTRPRREAGGGSGRDRGSWRRSGGSAQVRGRCLAGRARGIGHPPGTEGECRMPRHVGEPVPRLRPLSPTR